MIRGNTRFTPMISHVVSSWYHHFGVKTPNSLLLKGRGDDRHRPHRFPAPKHGQDSHGMRDAVWLEGGQACGQRILGQFPKKGEPYDPNQQITALNSEWLFIEIWWLVWMIQFSIMDACFLRQHALENMDLHMPFPVLERNKQIE